VTVLGRTIWVSLALAALVEGIGAQAYPILEVDGVAPYDALGTSVSGTGDVTGDGIPDFLVGAPGADPGGLVDAGRAFLLSGQDGAMLLAIDGLAPGDFLGLSVAAAGDVDGDGGTDLLVGAPQSGNGGAGYARAVSGQSGLVLLALAGSVPGDEFGKAVAGAGQVDADLFDDVLVGAPRTGSGIGPGYAIAFSGASGGAIHTLSGSALGDLFGDAVAGAADVDGDAAADLLVGIPGSPVNGVGSGEARLYSGADAALIRQFASSNTYFRLGSSVANAGDADGNGVPDQLVGARESGLSDWGRAYVFSGTGGATLLSLNGYDYGDWFGHAAAGVGDVDLDGLPDVVVGAPGAPLGQIEGYARLVSVASGFPIVTARGTALGDSFGWSVSGAGEVDGDGVPDFLVGAPAADPGGIAGAGRAQLLSATGIPPGSSLYGQGCPGSGGIVPLIRAGGGFPTTGTGGGPSNQAFRIVLPKALGGTSASLIVGPSSSDWMGIPLPFDLGLVGMPGCSLLVAPFATIATSVLGSGPVAGVASVPMPVPSDPALAGGHVFFQWIVADPGPSLLPGAMTRGLDLLVL
jgi:hypothetical protein